MDLSEPPAKPRKEAIVPMINVVFLLLIFFLMTSQLSQPEPFEVTPPVSSVEGEPESEPVLYVNAEGRFAFESLEGEQAIEALASQSSETDVIQLRADAELAAGALAKILRDLSAAGLARVELVVAAP
ncbi:MAG: biopolymer transporter ExbD [Pseudomonadota bacterium]